MKIPYMCALILTAAAGMALCGCVHEMPETAQAVEVRLTFHHETGWTEYHHQLGVKGRAADDHRARYLVYAYPEGSISSPALTFSFYRDDLSLQDFTTSIALPPGRWDIYAWQDLEPTGGTPYYKADDLSAITHTTPYRGDTERRDAFEGRISVEVPESYDAEAYAEGTVDMERPLARYVFIATDFDKFYDGAMAKLPAGGAAHTAQSAGQKAEQLSGYSIVVMYPYYMPAVYNRFTQRVTDSWSGVNFGAQIRPLSDSEAAIGSDHLFMNHHQSSAQVQLGLRTPSGELQRLTDVLTIPVQRGQVTYVRGDFLTAGSGSGLDIDFEFSGDINIKVP